MLQELSWGDGSDLQLPAAAIPLSVVRLALSSCNEEFVDGLLDTRDERELRVLELESVADDRTAHLLGVLVSTDSNKQWRLECALAGREAVSAFCDAVTSALRSDTARHSSLVELCVNVEIDQTAVAELLVDVPSITSFELVAYEQVRLPLRRASPVLRADCVFDARPIEIGGRSD